MDEIIDYVMTNPENTNPNVLRGMLENSSGSGDFRIAEVEITNQSGAEIVYLAPVIENGFMYVITPLENNNGGIFETVLPSKYLEAHITYEVGTKIAVDGAISYGGNDLFTIKGNGSITFIADGK